MTCSSRDENWRDPGFDVMYAQLWIFEMADWFKNTGVLQQLLRIEMTDVNVEIFHPRTFPSLNSNFCIQLLQIYKMLTKLTLSRCNPLQLFGHSKRNTKVNMRFKVPKSLVGFLRIWEGIKKVLNNLYNTFWHTYIFEDAGVLTFVRDWDFTWMLLAFVETYRLVIQWFWFVTQNHDFTCKMLIFYRHEAEIQYYIPESQSSKHDGNFSKFVFSRRYFRK